MPEDLPTTVDSQTPPAPEQAGPPPGPAPEPEAAAEPSAPEQEPPDEAPAAAGAEGHGTEEAAPAEPAPEEAAPAAEGQAGADEGEEPAEEAAPAAAPSNKRWYVVKVQSGREESIKEAIERRVKIEGLEEFVGRIVIPIERYTELRNNKRVQRTRKLYPGYLMVECEYNDRILYLFRETSGVGDFVGGGINKAPPPMPDREVESMLQTLEEVTTTKVRPTRPKFDRGDRVRVKDGTFAGMEGEVKEILETRNLVRVELTIFGRPVPVELEYWQVELV
jgi:transcription termination/antitermination protein NusG